MSKRTRKASYIVKNPSELNLRFYQVYDESLLLTKALALASAVNRPEELRKLLESELDVATDMEKRITTELKAEIYFTEFHQFECFFALLIAIFQDLPHWLFLTTYRPGYIRTKAQAYLDRDIDALTNGRSDNLNDFLNSAIYDIYYSCTDGIRRANWQTNLDNIVWILDRMARKYIKRGQEYNAYKHGLRIAVGSAIFGVIPDDNPAAGLAFDFGDAVAFLELKEEQQDLKTVYHTTYSFNIEESLNHLVTMRRILETVKSVRLARMKGETAARINTFFDVDKDKLYELESITTWSDPV